MFEPLPSRPASRVWEVGSLCRAIADSLEARFNPVSVRGEISGFSRAGSGHCYFTIKDAHGQLRCAMFRRAAQSVAWTPRDGDLVEVRGKLGVYEQRGDLQLIVESLQRAGQGAWFEQFLRLKAQLEAEGLFDAARKRPLPAMPRGIGVVTSLGAAAWHDVVAALRRRVPHIPVVIAPSLVQGAEAPASLVRALEQLYALASAPEGGTPIDTILLVRGGGSMEDLWAFNDEALARTLVRSPVPLVSGVGHETDFTIADFCADVRAPTPTAAAELVAAPRQWWLEGLEAWQARVQQALQRRLDQQAQRLDTATLRLGRPSQSIQQHRVHLAELGQRGQHALRLQVQQRRLRWQALAVSAQQASGQALERRRQQLERLRLRVELLNPQHVLERGYSVLTTRDGTVVSSVRQAPLGTPLTAVLADGRLDLSVTPPKLL